MGVAGAEPQAIIDTDFGAPGKPFETITAARGVRITGRLSDGWNDNSGWKSNVLANYKPMSEAGRRFLRVEQTFLRKRGRVPKPVWMSEGVYYVECDADRPRERLRLF